MKKLVVEKSEGIAEVIDRMINEPEDELIIIVPKSSVLVRSASNFRLLKREADAAGKAVKVESVDEVVLEFAKENGLEAAHPLWRKEKTIGGMSDIIPTREEDDDENEEEEEGSSARTAKKIHGRSVKLKVHAEASHGEDEDEAEEEEMESDAEEEMEPKEKSFFGGGTRFFKQREAADEDDDDDSDAGSRPSKKRWIWTTVAIVLVIIIGAVIATTMFGHVTIAIDFKQTPWADQANFTADKSASTIDAANNVIPAQVFTNQKNTTQLFPASGKADVSIKAQGTITIYNDYSSAPQELVATTRFEAPDGKIFRIPNDITVPGATVANGVITPSSVTSPVVADQAGPDYNEGPVAKLTIPGFASNAAKEAGFYGQLVSGTTGGFTGNKAVPTAADITAAKASTTALLESSLSSGLAQTYPNNFKILDGATDVQVTSLVVNTSTDANGDFSVLGTATLQAIGFDESALKAYLLSTAQSEEASSTFSSVTLDYGNVQANFTNGTVSFSLTANGELEPIFDTDAFKQQIEGQSISAARLAISNIPQLANGSIAAWPMWILHVPTDPGKIQITTQ